PIAALSPRFLHSHSSLPPTALPSFPYLFFFFNATATTEIYTLSLHDALPISTPPTKALHLCCSMMSSIPTSDRRFLMVAQRKGSDRKSTRLNSSHVKISYAVFCLKKKKKKKKNKK